MSASDGKELDRFQLPEVVGKHARDAFRKATMTDLFYSFGICHPGALVLRNFPAFLREFARLTHVGGNPGTDVIDLAAVDILRDRERGVPRYNQFRELLHLPRFHSLDHLIRKSRQLSGDPDLAAALKRLYKDDVDQVDLMVGLYAETPPPLFGFSDTAFRIFILMASRRLKSDRFFTTDFNADVYSQAGFDWVNDNGMLSVLRRHYPGLEPALRGVDNAFKPWQTIAESMTYHPYEEGREPAAAPAAPAAGRPPQ
jgi:hypothetical protein